MLSVVSSECESDVEHIFNDLEATRASSKGSSSTSIRDADPTSDSAHITNIDQPATKNMEPTVVDLTLEDGENNTDTDEILDSWMTHEDMQLRDLRWHKTSVMTKKAGAVFWPVRILQADELITNGACLTGGIYCELLGDPARRITEFSSLHNLPPFRGPNDPDTKERYEEAKIRLKKRNKRVWVRWKNGLDFLKRAYGILERYTDPLEQVLRQSKRKAMTVPDNDIHKAPAKRRKVVKYIPYKKEIKLHVGDIIQYNNRLFTMGSRQGREFSQIIEIDPSLPSPLVLDSGYKLKRSDVIMRVKRADGKPEKRGQEGCQKPLKFFFFSREKRLEGAQTMQEELLEIAKRDREEINEQAMAMAREPT